MDLNKFLPRAIAASSNSRWQPAWRLHIQCKTFVADRY